MQSTLALLLGALALTNAQPTQRAQAAEPSHVPNAYFVHLRNTTADGGRADPKAAFHRKCAEKAVAYNVRYEFNDSDLFYGLSVSLSNDSAVDALKSIPEVTHVSPVRWIPRPELDTTFADNSAAAFESNLHHAVRSAASHHAKRATSADAAAVDFNSAHRLTGVDEAHAAGVRGAGVKIAIVDSGVDHRHPALGGCFGSGCKFSFGYDLVGDAYDGYDPSKIAPKPDPLTTCLGGFHGTHVSGIVGMDATETNDTLFSSLVGVAPEAELGMYRVFGCTGGAHEDVIVAAMQRAADDGPHLISMSLGGYAAWGGDPSSPYLELVAGLKRRGIAVVAAAGNNGESGPFWLSDPAIMPDALAVASVENSEFPTYELRDDGGESHRYGALYPFPSGNYTAVVAGDGSAQSEFGCFSENYEALAANLTGDISNYVVVVKRGWCPVTVSQQQAVANGFTKILTFPDPDSDNIFIQGYGVPVVAVVGNGTIVSIGSTTDSTIYDAIKTNGEVKLSFTDKTPVLEEQFLGGQMNNFSSVGPSWDFALKPQIAAPGGNIISTYPLGGGGWAVASGTSMAAPYLSGVYALVKSQHPDLSIDEIFDILKTTAKPLLAAGREDYSPTPQQGAGLVSAADAVFHQTTVSPSQFELGGTEKLATVDTTITLRNPTAEDVTYELGHTAANGMAFYPYGNSAPDNLGWSDGRYINLAPLPFAASIKFPSSTSVTVPAGGSASVAFTVSPPTGLDPKEIPIYSGFITATSSLNETLSIPYVGAPYDYATTPLIGLDPPTPGIHDANRSVFAAPQVYQYGSKLAQGAHQAYNFYDDDTPVFRYSLLQPTRWTRVDVVDAATDFVPTWYGYDPTQAVTNYTRTSMTPNGTVAGVEVLGNIYLFSGDTPLTQLSLQWSFPLRDVTGTTYVGLKKGGYRLLVQWLRFGGDEEKREDWESWMSGIIESTRDAYEGPVNGTVV
ncbi:putative subtilisin-like protease protein [Lasiodiplodia theobromae]|uniref:Minor extracellular protease vpr n=1 Tax=Lasiodiplodia theobromae TaxID=45133 RepID=A0A5N5D430_9PEZI|nr:Subtilisin-like protease protein [Lasiodiplodia theobromae]KAB2572084.1 Minor extracellular protease vpr [Lasiodiplodia theobromae]KAF4536170.1 Subtilisin-like protease protein [Lasiodiplodia theobromae]KAF9634296.1 putative subtilisin-like protease protein [Lasiodiplodia theobromae]